jgi:hypothetical protein
MSSYAAPEMVEAEQVEEGIADESVLTDAEPASASLGDEANAVVESEA